MSTIFGIIIVIMSAIFGILLIFSCTDTYRNMVIEQMKKEEEEKLMKSIPDKIIINIKHEKVSDDENEDRDCQKHTANRRNFS